MAKGYNQKSKLLYLVDIFERETDEEHPLTLQQIISHLQAYDVSADRKTLYSDFEELRNCGFDIINVQDGRSHKYYLGQREFELPELKLLVDCVQSAKFITDRKSNTLIKKIESLGSRYQAKCLNRQVAITGRVKTMNESIYYNVDCLHDAINKGKKITFYYYQWNTKKEPQLRHDGKLYETSPWGLMWDDENYYMVAYDSEDDVIKHYRVDKMLKITLTDKEREGKQKFKEFDLPRYTKSIFGMFSGEETDVTLVGDNDMVGVIIDRFGKDIGITPVDKDHFKTRVKVRVSDQFLAWIISLDGGVVIKSPQNVVDMMKTMLKMSLKQYS